MQYSTHAAIYSSFICNACFFSIISSLSCLQLVRHIFLLLSERREKPTGTCWSYQCFPFIYHPLSFALFLSKASQSSLCVLFPLQQCVALVITSCLKQTDGITESDGQFSQCLFSPCMCTQPPFVCVFCGYSSLLATTSSSSPLFTCTFPVSMADVCCVSVCTRDVGNYLTGCVSGGWEWDSLISCSCVGHLRCQVSLWTSAGAPGGITALPFSSPSILSLNYQGGEGWRHILDEEKLGVMLATDKYYYDIMSHVSFSGRYDQDRERGVFYRASREGRWSDRRGGGGGRRKDTHRLSLFSH